MNDCTFIILGASGDLAKRKLLPALYQLFAHNRLNKFVIVGAALDALTPAQLLAQAREHIEQCDETLYQKFGEYVHYQQLDVRKPEDFVALHTRVESLELTYTLSGNRIAYLAVGAHFFCGITQQLAASRLVKKWNAKDAVHHRIVYEKPFGHDAQSARDINACIARLYDERQIYRIDHYLTKELVGNIALVRFTNCVFEPLWNNRYIDSVQVVLSEKVCVGTRGAYFDKYGALCDVVQNHMLEIVALLGMEAPQKLTGEYIRDERVKVLSKIHVVDALFAQYEGYRQEKNVAPDSTTETFALVYLTIQNHRWAGVPFYLKTGKCLDKKETIIHIKFKQVDCLLARNCPTDSNYLTIRVTPDASFSLNLNAKKPGPANEIIPVTMDFCHSCIFGMVTQEAYEIIFEEVMRDEQSVSVRFDEIEYAWRVIDQIKQKQVPVYPYKQGSTGPEQVHDFERKHGMRWRS